nr:MAG TPA: Insulin-degrading enzyme [Caudoviricetes sp.]
MIVGFNPLALRALPLYSLTETQRERFKSGISCFGIRIDFILLALRVLSLSYL